MQNIDLSKIVKVVKAIIFVISVHNHKLVNPLISQLICFQCKPREWRLNQGFRTQKKESGLFSCIKLDVPSIREATGSFSIDDCNRSENFSFKMNSPFFQSLSRLFQFTENGKCRRISLELISWGLPSSLEREKEIRRRLFTSSIKLAIRHFHVVVVRGR